MRMIPGKTKVRMELFKGVTLVDVLLGVFSLLLEVLVVTSNLSHKWACALVLLFLFSFLFVRINTEPNYIYVLHILRHCGYRRSYEKKIPDKDLLGDLPDSSDEDAIRKIIADSNKGRNNKKPLNPKDNKKLRFGENNKLRFGEIKELSDGEDKKLRAKENKKLRAEEDRVLKSKTATKEERDAVLEGRNARIERNKRIAAQERDATRRRRDVQEVTSFTDIRNGLIEYDGQYYGAVLEIPPVEFRFFSPLRRNMSIEQGLGKVLRAIGAQYAANIVKLERPVYYDEYLKQEYDKLDKMQLAYEKGMLTEPELQARMEILYDRISELQALCYKDKIIIPCYYLVLYDSDIRQLELQVSTAINDLHTGELNPIRLDDRNLALFLRYSHQLDFDERELDRIDPKDYGKWAKPSVVHITPRRVELDRIITHNFRVVGYPTVVGDAWMAGIFSMPGTKCVIKCTPMDRGKAIRAIDRSLEELRDRWRSTNVDSRRMELETHVETLSELLSVLQQEGETVLQTNIYITAYDIVSTERNPNIVQPEKSSLARISAMKKAVRRLYLESGVRLNNLEFDQMQAYIGSQISGFDPFVKDSRGIPSNSLAATYPWIYANVSDKGGMHLGSSGGVPVFIDFFRRDSERLNSNMVIVGKSGSGKSYATKSLLVNLAADDSKIFILDPENEYTELADNLKGRFINVGNATQGRLNPFHIITALDDDEGGGVSGSYATHLQFLEEFFRQILPDCEKDALEYLNSLVDRMYRDKGITTETDLSKLRPSSYPIFDDLYDVILLEFQQTSNDYIRTMLRVLMNYISKFSTGGRNANIWNGPSSVTTEENFIVFNFQSLLANRNMMIANAQMLLVLKYVDNEIIKNRDYNRKYGLNRKIIVVIDEAHVFIDTKYPAALDFMFQLAKRIRKYNGMQIVITQNIKDFVGSEEIARKSTAIINACQYSLIFPLAPNDMHDLCTLYEKAGGINETEQDQIIAAPRGQAFTILGPASRTSFRVETPDGISRLFSEMGCPSTYFGGENGASTWEEIVGEHRSRREANGFVAREDEANPDLDESLSLVTLDEQEEAEADATTMESILVEEWDESDIAPLHAQPISPTAGTPSGNTDTERLLEAVGKFSYDAMRSEIQHTVRQQMETELATQRAELSALQQALQRTQMEATEHIQETPAIQKQPDVVEPDEKGVPVARIDVVQIPAPVQPDALLDKSPNELPNELPEGVSTVQEDESVDPSDEGFDLSALLNHYADKIDDYSPIDAMELYGETTAEVSLEQLTQYNARKK